MARIVGSTASVAYGHTVGKVLAFAYVKPDAASAGTRLEVFMNESWRPAPARLANRPTIRKACCRAPMRPAREAAE
jgi:dimethylglycine dehydrogenase